MISVGIGKIAITDINVPVRALGLGSCVGVILFNEDKTVAGMAHVMLPETTQEMELKVLPVDSVPSPYDRDVIYVVDKSHVSESPAIWGVSEIPTADLLGPLYVRGASMVTRFSADSSMEYFSQVRNLRFAQQSLSTLIKLMKEYHSEPKTAVIAGGAEMFANNTQAIGQNNAIKIKEVLKEQNIELLKEDIGGNMGRSVTLHWESKTITLKTKEGESALYSW